MSQNEEPSLPVDALRQIDEICDRFEAALKANERPDIEEYAGNVCDDARDLLRKELEALIRCRNQIAPGQADSTIVLLMKTADGRELERTFAGETSIVLGRSPEAHWILEDSQVDKLHCCITIDPPGGRMLDLGSGSGTWVNGMRRRDATLVSGDVIRVGTTEIIFNPITPTESEKTQAVSSPRLPQRNQQVADADSTAAFSLDSVTGSGTAPLTTIPGYMLVREIGRGGMGVVYEAVQKSTGRPTALKVIIPPRSANEKAVQMFLREASTLSQLKHKRIVQFYELGISGGQMFLAMEYVKAMDFKEILQQPREPHHVRIFCAITCQVLEALDYAHGLGLVHRDVKLSNILVTREGKKLRTKLTDFGLAKNFQNAGLSEMTEEGEARGTLSYMPPEQLENSRYAKPPADIYATGVLLYHLLSGKFPFEATEHRDVITRIMQDDPVRLETRCPDLPEELVAIVHRALAKKPRKRFRSADEMRQALLPFARGPHDRAPAPPPAKQESVPWHRRAVNALRNRAAKKEP